MLTYADNFSSDGGSGLYAKKDEERKTDMELAGAYADVCGRVPYADVCRMLTYADVCRMLTYADVC
jgi:hypothetical protein